MIKGILFNTDMVRAIQDDRKTACPYQPGDILYVREAWAKDCFGNYVYKADYIGTTLSPEWRWHPSIHMPKEAVRIWLRVTDLRVERLQDIMPQEAIREGVWYSPEWHGWNMPVIVKFEMEIWNPTIKKKEIPLYGWEANPWVWVIEFERTVKPDENISSM